MKRLVVTTLVAIVAIAFVLPTISAAIAWDLPATVLSPENSLPLPPSASMPPFELHIQPWMPRSAIFPSTDNSQPNIGNPQPNIGDPLYEARAWSLLTNNGAYATVSPTTVRVDDRGDGIEEYWVSVVAVNENTQYYAEVGLDVAYDKSTNLWWSVVYSAYSDPNQWPTGTLNGTYSLGSSSTAPASASLAVYRSSGNTFAFQIFGYDPFHYHTYASSWTPSEISFAMESRAVPHGFTNGQTIVTNSNINYKDTGSTNWYANTPANTEVWPGSQLSQTITTQTQTIKSTRYWP